MGNRTRPQLLTQQDASLFIVPKHTQAPSILYLPQNASQVPSFSLCLFCQSLYIWAIESWDTSTILTEGKDICFRFKGQIKNTLIKRNRCQFPLMPEPWWVRSLTTSNGDSMAVTRFPYMSHSCPTGSLIWIQLSALSVKMLSSALSSVEVYF